ncbi:MAG: hypothetical protein RML40_00090 [Bacteroidota bacterium]|nr:hypothetical protein [Candidatus Kapabacteria bacterium]MDW8218905.1 hypothetical protein [Bacteroidota bacterium]
MRHSELLGILNERMNYKAITWLLMGCIWNGLPMAMQGQTATGPEQDCFAALPINRTIITQQLPYVGRGIQPDITSGFGGCAITEVNSVWYRLNVAGDGLLSFRITPLHANDDYDFLVLRLPENAPTQLLGCITALQDGSNVVACNVASGTGATGLESGISSSLFGTPLQVRSGQVYVIVICNRNGNGGFTLDLSRTTPGVIPTATTFPVAEVSVRANQVTNCGEARSITVTFSEPILRSSVQTTTFRLRGPNNQNFTITGVACANCPVPPNADSNTRRGVSYTLTISPSITASGIYTLSLSDDPNAVVLRNIDNSPIAMPSRQLIVNIGSQPPTISSSRPVNSQNTTTFCLGQSVTLTTPEQGAGSQYQWFRETGTGALVPVLRGTSNSITITGSYAFLERPETDSSTVVIVTRTIAFRVRVTDGNGCTRMSNPIFVNVSPGRQARILEAPATGTELNICRNEGITLTAEAGFRSYRWYANFTLIDTSRSRALFVRDGGVYAVETEDENGCRNLSQGVSINPRDIIPPSISGDTVNCADTLTNVPVRPIILAVNSDPTYRSYQWFDALTNRPIPGATGTTLSVTTGTFYVVVQATNGCTARTTDFRVRLGEAPQRPLIGGVAGGITQAICPGDSLPMTAIPSTFPRYQWYLNGVPIPGATGNRYVARTPGNYAVQAFSPQNCPSPISSPPVTITSSPTIAGTIRSNTNSFTICRGSSIRLSITIPNNLRNRATIEWTRAGRTGVIGTDTAIVVLEAGEYRVIVQFENDVACPVSAAVNVNVQDNPVPVVVTPTGGNTYCQGESLTLDAGGPFTTYQWFRVQGTTMTAIAGATERTLVVRSPGVYRVTVTAGENCTGTSAPFTVVELPTPPAPEIASRNGSLSLCPNGTLELFVRNPDPSLTYQWFFNDQIIPGATRTSLVVSAVGRYVVEARSNNGCVARPNAPATVTMGRLPVPPSFPATITICPGADTVLTAPAGFLAYQWLTGTGAAAQPIPGETNRQFRINRAGTFSLRVTDSLGCVNTTSTITVNQTQVVVRIDTIDGGVRFRASSTPRARLFQWLLNGMNIPGATDSILAPQASGLYSVRIIDINGCPQVSSAQRFDLPVVDVDPCPSTQTCGQLAPVNRVTVRGDSAFGAPGDTVVFAIRLISLGTLRPGTRVDATVCFNATILEPLPPLGGGTISNGIRCIPIQLTLPADTSQIVFALPFRSALGNDSITALVITPRLSPGGAPLPLAVSYFRLTTISYAGGPRLIGPPPRIRLMPIRPNPMSDEGILSYTLESSGQASDVVEYVHIAIHDVFGRVVKTLPLHRLSGAYGEIPLSTSDLTPGVYFVRMRSEHGITEVQCIHIMR